MEKFPLCCFFLDHLAVFSGRTGYKSQLEALRSSQRFFCEYIYIHTIYYIRVERRMPINVQVCVKYVYIYMTVDRVSVMIGLSVCANVDDEAVSSSLFNIVVLKARFCCAFCIYRYIHCTFFRFIFVFCFFVFLQTIHLLWLSSHWISLVVVFLTIIKDIFCCIPFHFFFQRYQFHRMKTFC